jgi:large subunit ribosomal protein L4
MEAKIYNEKGEAKGTVTLPESIFGLSWNADLVHQVVVSMTSSARSPIAHTKTRGEVRGGGKKPWKQKGTGQARHGSTRSPIWVGGGVTHGPRNDKNYDRKVNRKMKAKALFTILSQKMRDGEITFLDSVSVKDGKTKNALGVISNIKKIPGFDTIANKKQNALYVAMPEKNESNTRGFGNIGNVMLEETRNMNPVTILQYKGLVIVDPDASIKFLLNKISNTGASEVVEKKAKVSAPKKTAPAKKVTKAKAKK